MRSASVEQILSKRNQLSVGREAVIHPQPSNLPPFQPATFYSLGIIRHAIIKIIWSLNEKTNWQPSPPGLHRLLCRARTYRCAVHVPRPRRGFDFAVYQLGHGAVQGCVHRHGEKAVQARRGFAEVYARGGQAQRP